MNELTKHQQECLDILQEECAEIIQAISKIRRFGLTTESYYTPGKTNKDLLEGELGDAAALVDLCIDSGLGITKSGIKIAKNDKMKRLEKWMHTWGDRSELYN